jgi:hypothetical protein
MSSASEQLDRPVQLGHRVVGLERHGAADEPAGGVGTPLRSGLGRLREEVLDVVARADHQLSSYRSARARRPRMGA